MERRNYIPIEFASDQWYIIQFLDDFMERIKHSDKIVEQYVPWESIRPDLENDFEIVKRLFGIYGLGMNLIPPLLPKLYLNHKKAVVKENVKRDGLALKDFTIFNNDKEIVLEAIKQNVKSINYVNKILLKDREFILEMVRSNGMVLPLLANHYQYDREIAIEAISNNVNVFKLVKEKLCNNRTFVMEAVKANGKVMEFVSEQFIKDRELILMALNQIANVEDQFTDSKQVALTCVKRGACFIVLQLEEFRNDIDIVIESLKENGSCNEIEIDEQFSITNVKNLFKIMECLAKDLKNNRIVTELLSEVLKIVSLAEKRNSANSGLAATVLSCIINSLDEIELTKQHTLQIFKITSYLICSESSSNNVTQVTSRFWNKLWGNDQDFMLLIVECNFNFFLDHVNKDLKNDRNFMMKVVKLYPQAIEYASIFLKNNRSFILDVLRECSVDLFNIETLLIEDRQFVLEAVSLNGNNLEYFPEFSSDRQVVLRAVENDGYALQYACEELCQDREIAMIALRNCGSSLEFLCEKLQQDREVVLQAVRNDPSVLSILCEEMRNDKEIILTCLRGNYDIFPKELKFKYRNDREFLLEAVKFSIEPLRHVTCTELKDDLEIMKVALHTDVMAIQYASPLLKNSKEIALIVVKARGTLLELLSAEMQNDKEIVLTAIRNMADSIRFASLKLQKDRECIIEALRNGLDCSYFIQAHITMDLEIFLETLKKDRFGNCLIVRQLMKEEIKEVIATKTGFCCRFEQDLFQKRIDTTYFGATITSFKKTSDLIN